MKISRCAIAMISASLVSAATPVRNQQWINAQQNRLQVELQRQQERIAALNDEARKGLQKSMTEVMDWAKDKATGVLPIADPALFVQNLVNQNLAMYVQAFH